LVKDKKAGRIYCAPVELTRKEVYLQIFSVPLGDGGNPSPLGEEV